MAQLDDSTEYSENAEIFEENYDDLPAVQPSRFADYIRRVDVHDIDEEEEPDGVKVTQPLHRAEDPIVFQFPVVRGREMDTLLAITQFIARRAQTKVPVPIASLWYAQDQPGVLYCEAYYLEHVRGLLTEGIRAGVSGFPYATDKIARVAPVQLDSALLVGSRSLEQMRTPEPGCLVRITVHKDYKGDLAYVQEVDLERGSAEVLVVPRLSPESGRFFTFSRNAGTADRLPQKLLPPSELDTYFKEVRHNSEDTSATVEAIEITPASALGLDASGLGESEARVQPRLRQYRFTKGGLLYLRIPLKALRRDPHPPFNDIQMLVQGETPSTQSRLQELLQHATPVAPLLKNDMVIGRGEGWSLMAGCVGAIVRVDTGDTVVVRVTTVEFPTEPEKQTQLIEQRARVALRSGATHEVTVDRALLTPLLYAGLEVRVYAGEYSQQGGQAIVERVFPDRARVQVRFTGGARNVVSVPSNAVARSDTVVSLDSSVRGRFKLLQLVRYANNIASTAIIIGFLPDAQVRLRNIRDEELIVPESQLHPHRSVASSLLDHYNSPLHVQDSVHILIGRCQGSDGVVVALANDTVFVQLTTGERMYVAVPPQGLDSGRRTGSLQERSLMAAQTPSLSQFTPSATPSDTPRQMPSRSNENQLINRIITIAIPLEYKGKRGRIVDLDADHFYVDVENTRVQIIRDNNHFHMEEPETRGYIPPIPENSIQTTNDQLPDPFAPDSYY